MRKNNLWESLVGIIIWVTLLSICVMWILNLILFSNNLTDIFNNTTKMNVLKDNVTNVIKKVDTSSLLENEAFFLYKNELTNNFEIYSWTGNVAYKYINDLWDRVDDPLTYSGYIYARLLWVQREDTSIADNQNQIIKASIRRLIKKTY